MNNVDYNITKASDSEFILSYKGANYLVGEIVYILLSGLKNGGDIDSITKRIKEKENYKSITTNDVKSLLKNQIYPLLNKETVEKKKNPVKSLFIIFRPKNNPTLKLLTHLFSSQFFWVSFLLLTCFSGYIIFKEENIISSFSELGFGWILTVLFTILIIFLHEMGHVIAAMRYEVTPKEVGFGIYFIYPAFYTDLSEIWKLNKKYRIIINLAGIYFQMLLNIVLSMLILFFPDQKALWVSMLFSNMSIMFFNLNPLFKFDGYWIYSDYFEIHNLREQSNKIILNVFKRKSIPKIERKKRIPLIIYTICYVLFMTFVWFYLSKYLLISTIDLYTEYTTNKFSTITDFETIKKIFVFGFVLFLVLRILLSLIKSKISKKLLK
jgi:putative peptide zinc metalloprotease protein